MKFSAHRKPEGEDGAAATALTGDRQLAPMREGDGAADRQTHAGATAVAVTSGIGPVEALEDVRQVFGFDAVSRVGDGDPDGAVTSKNRELDLAVLRRVSEGIRQQVAKHLGDPGSVNADERSFDSRLECEADPLALIALLGRDVEEDGLAKAFRDLGLVGR
jgi:hypothetical protein